MRGANVNGVNLVPEWLAQRYVSVGWGEAGELDPGMSGMAIFERLKAAYPDESLGYWRTTAGNLKAFVVSMSPGDLVVTVDGSRVFIGRVAGDVEWVTSSESGATRRRAVKWLNGDSPASRAGIQERFPSLYSRLRTLLAVSDLTGDLEAVAALVGLSPEPGPPRQQALAPVTEELAASLHVPRAWLQGQVLDLLAEKRQVIFYGPPGTGKTLVAQRLASHLVAQGGEYELIQFHPSYSYEDFFEGFRPVATDSGVGVTYELTPGPLRRIAEAAAADPDHPYVLVIDEINRGNIPKIFGELLFLLEYRDEKIPLQYSPQTAFGLPRNLYLIGTMNTADRSIALVDAALRRRFYFVGFMPREEPVRSVLASWLRAHKLDGEPARLVEALNDLIAKDEIAIGPSYFITSDGSDVDPERVWEHAILPLLEEHFYGTGRDVRGDFGLESLRRDLAQRGGSSAAGPAQSGHAETETEPGAETA